MTLQEAAELAVVLARNLKAQTKVPLHFIAQDVARLKRCGRRANTASINSCNVKDYDLDRAHASIRKGVAHATDAYCVTRIQIGGDPRGGSCLTLHFADGSSNRFDKEGWSI